MRSRPRGGKILFCLSLLAVVVSACNAQAVPSQNEVKSEEGVVTNRPARGEVVTIVGTYETPGDGVECPKIRTDEGQVFGVSHLPTDLAIGARVEVRGPYVVMTTCLGEVVYAEDIKEL